MFDTNRSGTGTAEWSERTENIARGCPNDCLSASPPVMPRGLSGVTAMTGFAKCACQAGWTCPECTDKLKAELASYRKVTAPPADNRG